MQKTATPKILAKLKVEGKHSFVSLLHAVLNLKEVDANEKVPIVVRASFTRAEGGHFYLGNQFIKNPAWAPIEMVSKDEFFYNLSKEKFYIGNKEVKAVEILKKAYELHTKTTRPVKGLWLRLKLYSRNIRSKFYKGMANIFERLLFWLTGDLVKYNMLKKDLEVRASSPHFRNTQTQVETVKGKEIDFYGVKVPQKTLLVFCIIHALAFVPLYITGVKPALLRAIFTNNFLTIIYAVIALAVMTSVPPSLLKSGLNFFSEKHYKCVFEEIKI